jgi:hypothetical protein
MFIEIKALEKSWNEANIKALVVKIIETFTKYDTNITGTELDKWKLREEVSIEFSGKGFATCLPFQSKLLFGDKFMQHSFKPGKAGYAKEKKFIDKRCGNDKIQILIWLVIHEYCHLFTGMQSHNIKFYEFIDKKYVNFLWYNILEAKNVLPLY